MRLTGLLIASALLLTACAGVGTEPESASGGASATPPPAAASTPGSASSAAAAASSSAAPAAASSAAEAATAVPVTFTGRWAQGSVLLGHAPSGTQIVFEGHMLRLTKDGTFVIGLDRDEKPDATLDVVLPWAKPQTLHFSVEPRHYAVQAINGLPPSKVNAPPSAMNHIRHDVTESRAARARDSDLDAFEGPFIWPATGRISGVFGSQRILNGEPKQPHYGVDVAVPIGTPVHAPADGIVSLVDSHMYFTGGTLMIDHGHGLTSAFLHLSKILVHVGDTVKQGQVVALSGMTGRATGPHLDWRVNWFDNHVDAQLLVPPMGDSAGGDSSSGGAGD